MAHDLNDSYLRECTYLEPDIPISVPPATECCATKRIFSCYCYLFLYLLCDPANAPHYQYFGLLVVRFTNTVRCLPLRHAVTALLPKRHVAAALREDLTAPSRDTPRPHAMPVFDGGETGTSRHKSHLTIRHLGPFFLPRT